MEKPRQQIHDPPPMSDVVPIQTRDFWVKVVEMLEQNWALIQPEGSRVTIYFLHDLGGVFDELTYSSLREAQTALRLNGFRRYDEDPSYSEMFARPKPPFRRVQHPNGPIYSSGEFWSDSCRQWEQCALLSRQARRYDSLRYEDETAVDRLQRRGCQSNCSAGSSPVPTSR